MTGTIGRLRPVQNTVDPPETPTGWRWPVAVMLLATAGAWLPLYLQRRGAHQPNVDDYLYTIVSRQLAHAGSFTDFLHTVLHTGQTAPLVVLLAAPGAVRGVDGAVAVELPLLLLLAGAAWLLARRWVPPWEAALIGFAAAANQAVLGWALMMHFSVAASAFCLLSLAAYLWSDGFRRWGWSALTGVAVGLLLLSRSLAPVYVATFAVVVAFDVIRRRRLHLGQAAITVLLAAAVAGPWWLVSGGTALHYLRTAGYESSSGFTSSGAHLSLHSLVTRVRWTLAELGTVQAIILLAAPLITIARVRRLPGALVVFGWLLLTLIALATSSNKGTGFGLPLLAVVITLTGALLLVRQRSKTSPTGEQSTPSRPGFEQEKLDLRAFLWSGRTLTIIGAVVVTIVVLIVLVWAISSNHGGRFSWPFVTIAVLLAGAFLAFRPLALCGVVLVIGLGVGAEWSGGRSQYWLGPPYRQMALQATNGAAVPNIDVVHREVARAIAGRATLLVRDDDLLNANGLGYTALVEDLPYRLVTAPFGDPVGGVRELKNAQFLLAGSSPVSYHDYTSLVERRAARDGWTKKHVWRLACGNTVDLWQKGAPAHTHSPAKHRSSSYRALILGASPAAYWRLGDRACNAADASGNDNTGTYVGKPQPGARPLIADRNASVHLNGDDEIDFVNSSSLSRTRAISIELWLRPEEVPNTSGWGWQLVSKWNTALLFMQGESKPEFVFSLYDVSKAAYEPRVMSTTKVLANHIYYVVGTYDGSELRLYVNGVLEAKRAHTGPLANSTYGGVIAAKGWGVLPSPRFRGTLDEIAIYGHALTTAQVKAHYRTGTTAEKGGH
jgi:hypothetical protein